MRNYKTYKIVVTVVFAIVAILSSIFMADILMSEENLGKAIGFVVWLAIFSPSFAVSMALSLIGVIISAINKSKGLCSSGTLVYFLIFTLLPIVIFGATVGGFHIFVN